MFPCGSKWPDSYSEKMSNKSKNNIKNSINSFNYSPSCELKEILSFPLFQCIFFLFCQYTFLLSTTMCLALGRHWGSSRWTVLLCTGTDVISEISFRYCKGFLCHMVAASCTELMGVSISDDQTHLLAYKNLLGISSPQD